MQFRTLETWPQAFTKNREKSRFSASWKATTELLDRELLQVRASNVVLQIAIGREELRLDGKPRASARPVHPGVILSFEMMGPDKRRRFVSMPCDTFTDWKDNLRAIALSLEALRLVNRYGVSQNGQQYTGWDALPPGSNATAGDFKTREEAALWLATVSGDDSPYLLSDPERRRAAYKVASRKLHPDAGGQATEFHKIDQAKALLEAT